MRQCDINFVYYIIKMIGNAAYVKSFNSLRNYRCYSTWFGQYHQYLGPSSIPINLPFKSNITCNSLSLQSCRYQHKGLDLKGLNLKSTDKQTEKTMTTERIVMPESGTSKEKLNQDQDTAIKGINLKTESEQKKITKKIVVPESLTMKEKLKKAVKEYGSTVIVFHIGISLMSLGTCYLLVSAGLDIPAILEFVGLNGLIKNSEVATSAGTFAISYAVHKVFAPVRIGITLVSVPFIVRYLKKIGFLKK